MATVLEIEVRTGDAEKRILDLEKALEKMKNGAQKASKDGLERLVSNGGAMGILNDLTGGLAMGFKDAYESIQLSNTGLKGMKAALLATGIGALVVAVGAIASNWEEIMKWANATSKEVDQQISRANELREITKLQYDILVQSDNILKSQGKTEEEIVELKRQALVDDISSLKLQLEANRLKQEELKMQVAEAEFAKGSANIWGQVKALFQDNTEELQAQKELVAEQEKEYLNLTNTLAGIELQQKAAEKARFDAFWKAREGATGLVTVQKETLDTIEVDFAASQQRITDELKRQTEERGEIQRQANADQIQGASVTNEQIDADNKKRQAEHQQDLENADAARKNLAVGTLGALAGIAEMFSKGDTARAKKAFQVSKALKIAEATASTYQAAVGAYASQMTIPSPDAPVRAAIAAGIAVAAGFVQVANIAKTKFEGGGGGGGGGSAGSFNPGTDGAPQGQSPQAAIDFSFLQQQPPLQTYVIGSEVKTANEATQKIKDQSTL